MGNFILGIITGGALLFYYLVNSGSDNSTEVTNMNTEVNLEWVNPTEDVCISNGGELEYSVCLANWQTAKNICEASGARLPTIDELRRVVTSCGGVVDNDVNNKNDLYYQSCYKRKGFSANDWYWSSIEDNNESSRAWGVSFYLGDIYWSGKSYEDYVLCVRGQ